MNANSAPTTTQWECGSIAWFIGFLAQVVRAASKVFLREPTGPGGLRPSLVDGGVQLWMFPEIERTLVSRERIAARVVEMAGEIARDLNADLTRDGHSALDEGGVVLVPIMTGASTRISRSTSPKSRAT